MLERLEEVRAARDVKLIAISYVPEIIGLHFIITRMLDNGFNKSVLKARELGRLGNAPVGAIL